MTDLSRSMLADCCVRRCRGGAPWRPWDDGGRHGWGVFFLPSFRLANRVSDVPQPQNHPKTNHCPTTYLHQ